MTNKFFKKLTSLRVAIMGGEREEGKRSLICGCCCAQKWLEIIAIFQIVGSITLIVTGSISLARWQKPENYVRTQTHYHYDNPRYSVGSVTIDYVDSGQFFQPREWTREHTGAILVYGLIFSILSFLMASILLRAAAKRILRLLYIWPVWVFVDVVGGWTSAFVLFQVDWLLIFLLLITTIFMTFTVFLILIVGRESKMDADLPPDADEATAAASVAGGICNQFQNPVATSSSLSTVQLEDEPGKKKDGEESLGKILWKKISNTLHCNDDNI